MSACALWPTFRWAQRILRHDHPNRIARSCGIRLKSIVQGDAFDDNGAVLRRIGLGCDRAFVGKLGHPYGATSVRDKIEGIGFRSEHHHDREAEPERGTSAPDC